MGSCGPLGEWVAGQRLEGYMIEANSDRQVTMSVMTRMPQQQTKHEATATKRPTWKDHGLMLLTALT